METDTQRLDDRLAKIEAEHRIKNIALVNRLIGILRNNDELARELRRALNGEAWTSAGGIWLSGDGRCGGLKRNRAECGC
jgi:hypothetical protein